MAKFQLKAGAEVDVLTEGELSDQVDRLEKAFKDKGEKPLIRRATIEVTTDGSGNLSGGIGVGGSANVIYQCPTGFDAFLNRLNVNVPGYTPQAPLTTGGVIICRNANLITQTEYFLPISGVIAPVVITEGTNSALWLNGGDALVVGGAGLPVNLSMTFTVQVRQWRAGTPGDKSTT